jgi:hypothetical protein
LLRKSTAAAISAVLPTCSNSPLSLLLLLALFVWILRLLWRLAAAAVAAA